MKKKPMSDLSLYKTSYDPLSSRDHPRWTDVRDRDTLSHHGVRYVGVDLDSGLFAIHVRETAVIDSWLRLVREEMVRLYSSPGQTKEATLLAAHARADTLLTHDLMEPTRIYFLVGSTEWKALRPVPVLYDLVLRTKASISAARSVHLPIRHWLLAMDTVLDAEIVWAHGTVARTRSETRHLESRKRLRRQVIHSSLATEVTSVKTLRSYLIDTLGPHFGPIVLQRVTHHVVDRHVLPVVRAKERAIGIVLRGDLLSDRCEGLFLPEEVRVWIARIAVVGLV